MNNNDYEYEYVYYDEYQYPNYEDTELIEPQQPQSIFQPVEPPSPGKIWKDAGAPLEIANCGCLILFFGEELLDS